MGLKDTKNGDIQIVLHSTSKVTVVGSLNADLVIQADRHPFKGETLIGDGFDIFTGGKGFNQATAAARLGADITLIGSVGTDLFGDMLLAATAAEQMNTRIRRVEEGTGVASIVIEPDGDNSIIVVPRANMALTIADINAATDTIAESDVLLLQLETPITASESAAQIAKANGTTVLLNPAPAQPLPDSLLTNVDIIIPNQSETELLTGMQANTLKEACRAAQALITRLDDAAPAAIVLTLGAHGALLMTPTMSETIDALAVDAVDTTGAGDAFCGALATALARGEQIREAVAYANAAGAAAVTVLGATPSMPTSEKIQQLLADSKKRSIETGEKP